MAFGKNEKEQKSLLFWVCYQLICVYPQADPAGREVKEELWRRCVTQKPAQRDPWCGEQAVQGDKFECGEKGRRVVCPETRGYGGTS